MRPPSAVHRRHVRTCGTREYVMLRQEILSETAASRSGAQHRATQEHPARVHHCGGPTFGRDRHHVENRAGKYARIKIDRLMPLYMRVPYRAAPGGAGHYNARVEDGHV
jgi:hypothetical protein